MQFPALLVGDLDDRQAEPSEDLEVGARVTLDLGDAADQEHRHRRAALQQRARHDEAVAAVVAAPAEDGDAAVEQVVEERLHRRHDLPAGVLHQHERRDADVLDGAAIGFAHLLGVEDSHAVCGVAAAQCSVDAEATRASRVPACGAKDVP